MGIGHCEFGEGSVLLDWQLIDSASLDEGCGLCSAQEEEEACASVETRDTTTALALNYLQKTLSKSASRLESPRG